MSTFYNCNNCKAARLDEKWGKMYLKEEKIRNGKNGQNVLWCTKNCKWPLHEPK